MSDGHDCERLDAAYVFGGKPLQLTELRGGWRVSYDGKDVEHAHLGPRARRSIGPAAGLGLPLVRGTLEGQPGSDLGR